MSASNRHSATETVYHPLGAIRLMSPAEERATRRSATGSSSSDRRIPLAVERAVDVLRRFARVWVQSQQHRNGF